MDEETFVFSMHRLVQLSTAQWLSLQGRASYWQDKAIKALAECMSIRPEWVPMDFIEWSRTLLPHVLRTTDFTVRGSTADLAVDMYMRAVHQIYGYGTDRDSVAETVSLACHKASKHGSEISKIIGIKTYAKTLWNAGHDREAESLAREALRRCKRSSQAPLWLHMYSAYLLFDILADDWDDYASECQAILLDARRHARKCSPSYELDNDGLSSRFARICQLQGRNREAEKMLEAVWMSRRRKYGSESCQAIIAMKSLASFYKQISASSNAVTLYAGVLQ